MIIDVIDTDENLSKDQINLLQNVLTFAANKEKVVQNAELTISIVSNEEIAILNGQYHNKHEPTDVLSFQLDDPFHGRESIPILIGDIIISIDKVEEQSIRFNHSFNRELLFLAIHGFLHLLGYTHDNKVDERTMFQKQENILKEFNLERE